MRKAINFDIDTKKYEEYTGKASPTAYAEIRKFLLKHDFEHRQGSGYVSKKDMKTSDIGILATNMTLTFDWLKYCIKQIDVTNIGRQHSLIDTITKTSIEENLEDSNEMELELE